MHTNEKVIRDFYRAFGKRDCRTMQDAYHSDVIFCDPVFKDLNAREVKALWEMLVTRATDLEISCADVHGDDSQGRCRWEAHYTFSVPDGKFTM